MRIVRQLFPTFTEPSGIPYCAHGGSHQILPSPRRATYLPKRPPKNVRYCSRDVCYFLFVPLGPAHSDYRAFFATKQREAQTKRRANRFAGSAARLADIYISRLVCVQRLERNTKDLSRFSEIFIFWSRAPDIPCHFIFCVYYAFQQGQSFSVYICCKIFTVGAWKGIGAFFFGDVFTFCHGQHFLRQTYKAYFKFVSCQLLTFGPKMITPFIYVETLF